MIPDVASDAHIDHHIGDLLHSLEMTEASPNCLQDLRALLVEIVKYLRELTPLDRHLREIQILAIMEQRKIRRAATLLKLVKREVEALPEPRSGRTAISKVMDWLAGVCGVVVGQPTASGPLQAAGILELLRPVPEIQIPGLPDAARTACNDRQRAQALRLIGRCLHHCFDRFGTVLDDRRCLLAVGDYSVTRDMVARVSAAGNPYTATTYEFSIRCRADDGRLTVEPEDGQTAMLEVDETVTEAGESQAEAGKAEQSVDVSSSMSAQDIMLRLAILSNPSNSSERHDKEGHMRGIR